MKSYLADFRKCIKTKRNNNVSPNSMRILNSNDNSYKITYE